MPNSPHSLTVNGTCRIWAYWISPFAYLLRSIVINEMTSPHWDIPYSPGRSLGQVRTRLSASSTTRGLAMSRRGHVSRVRCF